MLQDLSTDTRIQCQHRHLAFPWAKYFTAISFLMFLLTRSVITPLVTDAASPDSASDSTASTRSELHVVAVSDGLMPNGTKRPWGESSRLPAEVHVNVTVLDVPVDLFLVASAWPVNPTSKPITWKIHASPGVTIARVVISGDGLQFVEGDIRREQWTVIPSSKELELPHTPKNHNIFTKKTTDLFGTVPVTYQFFEYGGNILVDGITTQCEYRFGQDINRELEQRESPRALPALDTLSRSPQVKDREQAAIGYRLHCQSAIPLLSRLIEDPAPSVRKLTIETLASLKIGTERFAPVLKVLEDPDKSVRMTAMDAELSMRDLRALPALVKTLKHADRRFRLSASQAVVALAPQIYYHKFGITLRDEDLDFRKDTFKAFVPDFIDALEDQNPEIKVNMARALSTLGSVSEAAAPSLVRLVTHDDMAVKNAAALALQGIGLTSVESVLALVDARESATDELRNVIDKAIEATNTSVMPQLERRLRAASSDSDRLRLVIGVRLVGQSYSPLIPSLLELCTSDSMRIASEAELALSIVGPPGTDEIQTLLQALTHPNSRIKTQSLKVLAPLGAHVPEIPPAAASLVQDKDPAVRTEARTALKKMKDKGVDHLVIRLLQASEQDQPEFLNALESMDKNRIRDRAQEVAPVLGVLLGHRDQQVRAQAASLLQEIGIYAMEPLIIRISQSTGKEETQLREALQSLGTPPVGILRDVITKTDNPVVARHEALTILESLRDNGEKSAADSSVALVMLLKDQDAGLRSRAAQILGSFGPSASHSIPSLIESLRDPQETVRQSALGALKRIGNEALPLLIEAVEHGDAAIQLSAIRAIVEINWERVHGPEKRQFQKVLHAILEDRDPEIRFYAAVAMARLHVPDPQAISILANALSANAPMMRLQSVRALGKITPAAVSAKDRLVTLAQTDESKDVRIEAVAVLDRMALFTEPPLAATMEAPDGCRSMTRSNLALSLRDAHAKALALYMQTGHAEDAMRMLVSACVHQAGFFQQDDRSKGLSKVEYATILNDFAFFELEYYKNLPLEKQPLSRAVLGDAIAQLTAILDLLPRRAVAHLNLNEALLLHTQFLEIDRLIQHYKHYKQFSKRSFDATGEWLLSLSPNTDVCHFAVALRNKGHLMNASAITDRGFIDIDNDGLLDRVTANRKTPTEVASLTILYGDPDKQDEPSESLEGDYLPQPDVYGSSNLLVLGFKQKYYVLHYTDTSHGVVLTHLGEHDDQGEKVICEFANTATVSLPKEIDKNMAQLGKDLLRNTIAFSAAQQSYQVLSNVPAKLEQNLPTERTFRGTGTLLWAGQIDIDNDGKPEAMASVRFYDSHGIPFDLFVKWDPLSVSVSDDWVNRFLMEQARAGFTLRLFTWKGTTYLEKRADMNTVFAHEILRLSANKADTVLAFDIQLQSQFSRYGKHPKRTAGNHPAPVKVIANIPR